MRPTARILWLLAATLAVTVAQTAPPSTKIPVVGDRFILEFASPSNLPARDFEERRPHDFAYASLKERGFSFQVDKEYNANGLFYGAAVTLKSSDDVKAVASTPGIVAVRPVQMMEPIKPVDVRVLDDSSLPFDTESTHVMTGVDKLHAEGITGKGIKIGIIDTGIDYKHPALGGGFGIGFKVVGGYDFVGDDYNGKNTPVPDPDPLDQCNGHGTHVAGIIGAKPGNKYNISGVAYDAFLNAYRVFGCSGSATDDIVLDALLRAASDDNDVLNLSLGGANGWTESSTAVVASRIAASGKIVIISAGNDGESGSWYSSAPGNGIDVISVASVENTIFPLQTITVNGTQHNPIFYFSLLPLPVEGALPIYATSNDTAVAADACEPLPAATPDLSKFVVVIRRGGCDFDTKFQNAANKGAKVAIFYDNGNGFTSVDFGDYTAALIQAADGEFLVKQFDDDVPVTLSFPQTGGLTQFPNPDAGLVSYFSTYGPSNDFFFKPAVAAPGGNIVSTLPTPLGSFGILSGTSMAAPFVAGSSALLFQSKGNDSSIGKSARTLFETTAKGVFSSHSTSATLQTLMQQGAGLIQVYNAIHYKTVVTPGEIICNDTAHFKGSHQITVTNTDLSVQTYKLKHVPAGTATTIGQHKIWPNLGPVPLTTQYATVTFSQPSFILGPFMTAIIDVNIVPPNGVDPTTFPVFSGFVQIDSDAESLHVPYVGLAASLIDKQVLDDTSDFLGIKLPTIMNSSGQAQEGAGNYTFLNDDVPTVVYRLVFGTPLLRIDLVKPDINFTPTLNTRAFPFGDGIYSFPKDSGGMVSAVPIVGPLVEFDYITRNNEDSSPDGPGDYIIKMKGPTFANGTTIPNGPYRFLLRALRVTGDAKNEKHYDSWLSPVINISA